MVEAPDAVERAVKQAKLGRIDRVRAAGAGNRNDVWLVDTAEHRVVVRLLHDDSRLAMETAVLGVAAEAGLPVARCLWSGNEPQPAMIQTALPGERLADIQPPPALHRELATLMRRIHAIPIDKGFGTLTGDLHGCDATLPQWFTGRVVREAADVETAPEDRRRLDAALSTLDGGRDLLAHQTSGLVHGDIQPMNLLVHDGRITGILDWEASKSGPPALDFGWWDWWAEVFGTPWSTEELIDAYDTDGSLERAEIDSLRRLVRLRIWTRELIAGVRHHQAQRAFAARTALAALL